MEYVWYNESDAIITSEMKNSKRWIHSNMKFKKIPCVEWIPFAVITMVVKETMTTKQTTLVAIST